MPLLNWSAHFETGHEEIDRQHRYLVDRLNEIAPILARADKQKPDGIGALFEQLSDYADQHFATEERLMAHWKVDPRQIARHHESHRRFVTEIREMASAYLTGEGIRGRELLRFIVQWTVFHILGEHQAPSRQGNCMVTGTAPAPAAEFDAVGDCMADPPRQALCEALIDMYAAFSEKSELQERRINELASRLQIIADHTVDWETWIDPAGRYVYCSPSSESMTGHAPAEYINDPNLLLHIVHPDDVTAVTEHFTSHVSDSVHPQHSLVFRVRHASGAWRWLEHVCRPIYGDDGMHLGRRASTRDVTDRFLLQQHLTDALAAAEKSTRSKSTFLSNMSHEIRTPLNAVIGSAMLMLQDIQEPRQRTRLERIATSSQQLLSLINDILDLAKIEAGRVVLETVDFEIAKVIETVAGQTEERLLAKGLTWHTDIDPALPRRLNGDPLRLGQILTNFVSNAVKFTERGRIDLRVSLVGRGESGLHLRFEVTDTGCGFDPAKAEAIFMPFEQEDGSTTRKHGGTGLGLAICRQLAHLMGGEVGATSQPRHGSTFWLEASLHEACNKSIPGQEISLKGKRAILIGDDDGEMDRVGQLLKQSGMFVQHAETMLLATKRIEVAADSGRPYEFMVCVAGGEIAPQFIEADFHARLKPLMTSDRRLYRLLATRIDRTTNESLERCTGLFEAVIPLPVEGSYLADTCHRLLTGTDGEAAPHGAPSSGVASGLPGDLSAYATRRLLLVEDNPINQEVMLDILASAGLGADVAVNGQEALKMVEARRYDLILMDMQMPVMGGVEATRAIRRMASYGETPILAMTANAFDSDRQACMDAGMNDHLAKPVAPEILYAALRHWLPEPAADALDATAPPSPARQMPINDAEIALPEIDGVDTAAGLRFLRGKRARYRQMLERLVKDHLHDPIALRENICSCNFVEARRIAHSLKGASAMLGAEAIRDIASDIEVRIRAGNLPEAEEEMNGLLADLARTLSELKHALP